MVAFDPIQTNEMPAREKLVERLWELSRPVLCGCTFWFARKWRLAMTRLFAALVPGEHRYASSASISRSCRIDYPWRVKMGDKSSVGSHAWIYALAPITIGNQCCIGEEVRLIAGTHDITSPHFNLVTKPITIGDNVWVATGATVLPGVAIGEGAVIGANAVVTKDVAPWTVVGGNPAKVIKQRVLKD